ncbi:DUF3617 domain-containing protein [Sphingomonas qilianensis]
MMGLLFVAVVGGAASAAQAPRVAALDALQPGRWVLKEKDGTSRSLCIADPRNVMQIQHGTAQCSRFVIANDPRSATVHYTCPGAGHGRSMIHVEGRTQFSLRTQGILEGAPFETEYEGHHVGFCHQTGAVR